MARMQCSYRLAEFCGTDRQIIVGVVLRVDRTPLEEVDALIEHTGIATRLDIPADRQRQPQVVVRTARPNAAPSEGGCHQCWTSPSTNWRPAQSSK